MRKSAWRGVLAPLGWSGLIAAFGLMNVAIIIRSLVLGDVAGVTVLASLLAFRKARDSQVAAQNAATSRLRGQLDALGEGLKRAFGAAGKRPGGSGEQGHAVSYLDDMRGTTPSGLAWGAAARPGADSRTVATAVENSH